MPVKILEHVELFKLFKLADFLCVNLESVKIKNIDLFPINDLLKYVYEKNDVDAFVKFQKQFHIKISLKELLDIKADDDFIMQVTKKFTIKDLNYLLENKKYDFIIEIFKKQKEYLPSDYIYYRYFYFYIKEMLKTTDDAESKKEIMQYILSNNSLIYRIAWTLGNNPNDVVKIFRKKIEKYNIN